ncbi:unnamed protein product [Fraxinus pennsylvanica]|uniref:Nucleolar protein 10-like N-terminal domain-containing protein n=1 Tax=Fraxinus pennsylvanica TaxID=56036 RepID=A0AAD2ECD5_9LAMI|nr:unnamed protein product [Fraxinus pennsylvanica]
MRLVARVHGHSLTALLVKSVQDKFRVGHFLSSLNTQSLALNVVSRRNIHGLVAGDGEDGAVECFDMRTRSSVGRINAVASAADIDGEVTAIEFGGKHGFFMADGSSGGKVLIFDLRKTNPVRVKDHIVRVWDPQTMVIQLSSYLDVTRVDVLHRFEEEANSPLAMIFQLSLGYQKRAIQESDVEELLFWVDYNNATVHSNTPGVTNVSATTSAAPCHFSLRPSLDHGSVNILGLFTVTSAVTAAAATATATATATFV